MSEELIIKVSNQDIHLSPKWIIPVQQTNIPIEYCKFRTSKDIYWKVELIEYNPYTKCWRMKVVDYSTLDTEAFGQQELSEDVERIAFEKFDWPKFERNLSSYQKIHLLNVLHSHDANLFFHGAPKKNTIYTRSASDYTKQQNEASLPQALVKTYNVEFSVFFSDTLFMLGYVTFNKHIPRVGNKIDFKISNDYVLAEFENIKSWFAKKLKTKKFNVVATITTSDGKITEATAHSPEIAMIDSDLIDSIKYQRTIALTKSPRVSETDKSLFTAEEIFGEMETEDIEGNVFNQNEHDILNFLLDHNKTRNRKQLEYLSGSKQSVNSKLRFTLHPTFGFLFFIEGKEHNHFVWELLDSHATYVWSIDKSNQEKELQYKRIESSISTIRESGREQYKRAYRHNHHDNDLVFSIIEHDDISSDFIDGFVKWKHKLNEKIT